ncbi:GSCFA family protein [Porphyromonadaceae bacterium KHP3R9]|nr:GSCFA family protein [Porphyromonadaceae bacterium KHP3R9]
MDFRTPVIIPESTFRIDHSTRIMMLGSCFTENICSKLSECKFRVTGNPFGIVYNPSSVAAVVNRILSSRGFSETDLVFHNGLYHSFLHHGKFSHPDKARCLDNITKAFAGAVAAIGQTDLFIVTFGTAYLYRLRSTGEVVANCHKFPADSFIRERLSVEEIVKEWDGIINRISALNPDTRIIFTVSPIRHWKDGAHGNQISKAILHLSIDRLQERHPERVSYFPAYEILLDELRDYRFFSDDMMHPSPMAINYIWERFSDTFFREDTRKIIAEWEQLNRSLKHAPLHGQTDTLRQFQTQTLQRLILFRQKYPTVDCNREIEELKEKIKQ